MWVGGGEKFGFINQPKAAFVNFFMFVKSIIPLLDAAGIAEAQSIVDAHQATSSTILNSMWARKMGFPRDVPQAASLPVWLELEALLGAHPTDYIILFRELMRVLTLDAAVDDVVATLAPAFYSPLPSTIAMQWKAWIGKWLAALRAAGVDAAAAAETMRTTNPKYILREWMLVEAYTACEKGDNAPLLELHRVCKTPYDDQPEVDSRFYKRQPEPAELKGGTCSMTCSS